MRYTRFCFELRMFTSEEPKQYKLIIFMAQGFPREAASCPANQEIYLTLCKQKFHYRIHNNPPMVPILSQMDPVHSLPSYLLRSVLVLSSHSSLSLVSSVIASFKIFQPNFICITYLSYTCYMHGTYCPP
jgi:hypothetical protein